MNILIGALYKTARYLPLCILLSVMALPSYSQTAINTGDVISDSIDNAGEADEFEFSATAGERLFFDVQSGSVINFLWQLSSPSGEELFTLTNFTDKGVIEIVETGTHVLRVSGNQNRTGDYQFQVISVPALTPTPIALDVTVESEISISGEQDLYTFSLGDEQTLFFDALSGPIITNWTLTDGQGNIVFSQIYTDVPSLLLPAGDYSLLIDGNGDDTFSYSFVVTLVPPISLTPIQLNEIVEGEIAVTGEIDDFLLELNDDHILFFDRQDGSSTRITWTLFDENDTVVFTDNFWSDVDSFPLGAGSYRLRVDGINANVLSYQFQIVDIPDVSSTAIALNEVIQADITVQGEVDEYTFSVPSELEAFFDRQSGASSAIAWTLSNADDLILFDDGSWSDIEPILLDSGDYTLRVDGTGDSRLSYQFQVHEVPETTTTATELYLGSTGEISVPGQRQRFEFTVDEPMTIGLERLSGSFGSAYSWTLFDENDVIVGSANTFASSSADTTVSLESAGTYTFEFDGNGDYVGRYNLRLWPVEQPQTAAITLDSVQSLRLVGQGQRREYQFDAVENTPLYLNIDIRETPRVVFSLFSPDGSRLFFNRTDDTVVASLPESGTYTLIAGNSNGLSTSPSGNYSFIVSQINSEFVGPPAAELQITSASAQFEANENPATIVVSYTVTNNGSAPTNADAWRDQIQFFTDNEFRLASAENTTPFDFIVPVEIQQQGSLAPGESYTNTVTIDYPIIGATSEAFDIVIGADIENQVYEASSDINEYAIEPEALFYDERLSSGQGAITSDIQDGSLLPANSPIVLSGNANISGGAVNVYFVVDVSASTSNPTGFDANGDGTINEGDDFNGDGKQGDVLDVEISSIINIANQIKQSSDDAFVSVVPFYDEAFTLDLGPERLQQSFVKPQDQTFDPAQTNIEHALTNNLERLFGTNFGAAIGELLRLATIAPPSEQNFVFFLTDGQALQNASEDELQALSELGITLFAFQINNNTISASLQAIVDTIDSHPDSNASAQSVVDPNNLPSLVLQSLGLANVEINGVSVEALDAAGNFFSTITLNEGLNTFTIAAIDNEDNRSETQLTLIGASADGNNSQGLEPSQALLTYDNAYFNRSTKRLFVDAKLQNNGALPITSAVSVDIQTDPVAVSLSNADAQTINGLATVIFDTELGNGIATSESSSAREMIFNNQRLDRFAVQSLTLTNGNTAPYFASSPIVTIDEGESYEYIGIAIDDDNDSLVYQLSLAPSGMSINAETGQVLWTPTPAQTGTHLVSISVSDGKGGAAEQSYQLSVTTNVANLAPYITSTPLLSAIASEGYQYQVNAVDPEGSTLTYSIVSAPAGLSLDASSGLLNVAAGVLSSGMLEISLKVVDSENAQAQQTWTLDVKQSNEAPTITSVPPTITSADSLYSYAVQVTDDDNDISFELTQAPLGMTINSFTGVITMLPTNLQIGSHPVSILVSDPFLATAVQNYTLEVSEDAEAPQVSIILNPEQIQLGQSSVVSVIASDNAGIQDISLFMDGSGLSLDATNSVIISPVDAGEYSLLATVTDINGLSSQDTATLRVIDSADVTPPSVSIESPSPSSVTSFLTDIVGTVEADDLLNYRLEYALANEFDPATVADDGPQWNRFALGTQERESELLGVFDPTILRNDDYVVRLIAEDVNGNKSAAAIYIGIQGDAKIGVFQLTYTDLAIPISNIPIEINRIYKTTDANVEGDFGYGWHLQYADPDIRETVPVANMEAVLGLFVNNPFRADTRVYINAPDGSRIGFTFEPESTPSFFGNSFLPKFTPDPGVHYELEVDPVTISQSANGEFVLFLIPFDYNPQDYRLIDKNGITWHYNQFSGLDKVNDRAGNELTFTEDGIFHSSGVSVTFTRDSESRITSITDPQGNQHTYIYSPQGELVAVSDPDGEVESYDYFNNPQHFMSQIVDASGNITMIEFDEDGRLSSTMNGLGELITQDWDPDSFSGTITDAKGNITQLTYDLQGNVISEEYPLGGIKTYAYDSDNNVISETDENSNTTTFVYDDVGNITSETDALGSLTQYSFDEFSNRTSIINALGHISSSEYDENGNLLSITLPDSSQIINVYDDEGRLISMTDAEGNQTTYAYSGSFTTPVEIVLPDGNIRTRTLDNNGLIVSTTDEIGNVTTLSRDGKGRVIAQTDADGSTYTYVYEDDLLVQIIDPSTRNKYFDYDDKRQLTVTRFEDGSQIEFAYDENGNRTSVTDVLGNVTTYTYDALDRLSSRTDANGGSESYDYDAAGNMTQKVDRRGYTVNYTYDALNRMLSETWLDEQGIVRWQLAKTYDAIGNVLTMDDGSSVITNIYDQNNRVVSESVSISSGPSSTLTFDYDGNDKLIAVSDSASQKQVTYNNRKFVERVSLSAEAIDVAATLAYDPRGLRASMERLLNDSPLGSSFYAFDERELSQSIQHNLNGFAYDFDYFWDNLARVSAQTQDGESISYEYDGFDQLIAANRSQQPDESYAFDINGNPSLDADVGNANRLLSQGDIEYDYDQAGNIIRRVDIQSGERVEFGYDHRNRLLSAQVFDTNDTLISDISYAYDPMDRRIKRSVNSQESYTNYAFDDAWTDMQTDGIVSKRYLNGPNVDEKVARIQNGDTAWYITDKQQTVHSIVDSNGLVINEIEYDSYGQVLSESNPNDGDRFTYTGRELSRELGIYDYRARSYDPVAKRFLSEDPIEFEANDANLYRYVFNNPLNATDPSGENALVEYGTLLCKIAVPTIGQFTMLGRCLSDLYEGIGKGIETATANDGLAEAFTGCVTIGTATNVVNNAVGGVNGAAGVAAGVYSAMPSGGPGDGGGGGGGGGGSPGDAAMAIACGAF